MTAIYDEIHLVKTTPTISKKNLFSGVFLVGRILRKDYTPMKAYNYLNPRRGCDLIPVKFGRCNSIV